MQFAYVFVLFFVDPSLIAKRKKNEGKTPQYCTLELFMTPPLKTNKQTKNWRENIDLAKMVSDCTIYIHIFSKKI